MGLHFHTICLESLLVHHEKVPSRQTMIECIPKVRKKQHSPVEYTAVKMIFQVLKCNLHSFKANDANNHANGKR